jgi:hypothetical protein
MGAHERDLIQAPSKKSLIHVLEQGDDGEGGEGVRHPREARFSTHPAEPTKIAVATPNTEATTTATEAE